MNATPAEPRVTARRRRFRKALNVVLALTGAVAVASLVMEYGGFTEFKARYGIALRVIEVTVVALFVLDRLLRLLLASRRLQYLRENWVDFALIGVLLAATMIIARLRGKLLSAGALYVAITQAYILVSLVLRGLSVNLQLAGSGIPPTWLLIGSFALMCLVGSGLLMLPAARPPDAPAFYYDDALFTAVSATCVTGLVVRDTGVDFTLFGQAVILVLIQLGGLGIMLFGTMMALLVGKGLSVKGSEAIGEMVGASGIGELGRAIRFVLLTTFILEAVGAALMYPMFARTVGPAGEELSAGGAVWHSLFHSISSFCNAGFSLYGANLMHGARSAAPLRENWRIMGVLAPLIILGGLGFPVLRDLARGGRRAAARLRRLFGARTAPQQWAPSLSLHSRVVLTTSAILIIMGAVVLYAVEPPAAPVGADTRGGKAEVGQNPNYQDGDKPIGDWPATRGAKRCREVLFQSITARTAGFNTVDMAELSRAGKLWMCFLMTVGGSPASTAGGMKTVTVAVLIMIAYSVLRRRDDVETFNRSLSTTLIRRTVTLGVLYMILVGVVTLLLSAAMRDEPFIDVLFEACSACGTVGLSTGVTGRLTGAAKHVIIGAMFVGRLGPLTLLLALTSRIRRISYSYPTGDLVIG